MGGTKGEVRGQREFGEWEGSHYLLAVPLLGLESGFQHGNHGGLYNLGTSHFCLSLSKGTRPGERKKDGGRTGVWEITRSSQSEPHHQVLNPRTDNTQASSGEKLRWKLKGLWFRSKPHPIPDRSHKGARCPQKVFVSRSGAPSG